MSNIESINSDSSLNMSAMQAGTVKTDDFLEMMVAQLQNQDPLDPLDGTDFTAQLAQFSSLEQLVNMNGQLQSMNLYQSSLNNTGSINLIGKEITAEGDTVKSNGLSVDLTYSLSANAQEVKIKIYDEKGSLVNTLESKSQKEGKNSVAWDCSSFENANYTFEVSAVDSNGDEIPASTKMSGKVTGVTFKKGYPYLSVNGQEIPYEDIISVNEPAV